LGEIRALVGVSSVGLGHIKRTLSIVRELEALSPNIVFDWVCAKPALTYLEAVGVSAVPESRRLRSLSEAFERHSTDGRIDSYRAVAEAFDVAKKNYWEIRRVVSQYELLVQDEFLETLLAHRWEDNPPLPPKRVAIVDFVDVELRGLNPLSLAASLYAGRMFRRALLRNPIRIFADDLQAAPRRLRGWVKQNFLVTGPIVAADVERASEIRDKLTAASGRRRIVCFTIGGTAIGKHILDLAWQNRRELSERLDALLLFLTGPSVDPNPYLGDEKRVVAVGFTPQATAYFAASDCVVTQGGASTLNELEQLDKPTVCVPIMGHWEQERNAQRFNTRENYAVLAPSALTAESLAQAIEHTLNAVAKRPKRAVGGGGGGAKLAAKAILGLLERN